MNVIGIDPGGKTTAAVILANEKLVDKPLLVTRHKDEDLNDYIIRVINEIAEYHPGWWSGFPTPPTLVAVEDVNPPNPHMGMANVQGILDTSRVIGALVLHLFGHYERFVMVPPARHGQGPLEVYPDGLVGANETKGTGKLRHARSAYDIALVAPYYYRTSQ